MEDENNLRMNIFLKQLQQLEDYIKDMSQKEEQVNFAIESLTDIKNTKKGTKILAPLTQGIFIEATLSDNQNVMVNTGANTANLKTIEESILMLNSEKTKIAEYQNYLNEQKKQIMSRINEKEE